MRSNTDTCASGKARAARPRLSFGGVAIVIFLLAATVFGQQVSAPTHVSGNMDAIAIGPGDLLDLTVFDVPELILKVQVDSSGAVSLPLIGDLKLAGMTVRDAQLLIARDLVVRQMVKKPEVMLLIEQFATQGVTVYGEVNTPGIYPLMGPHKLYDAISVAGGFTAKAGRTVTILHKGRMDDPETVHLSRGQPVEQANVTIYPGDTIIVSKAGVVYVLGEVNKPGAFLLEDNTSMSVMKAVALAQGTTKLASLRDTKIIKETPQGMVQSQIRLDKIYRGKASDLALEAEEIVFVPLSNLKLYGPMGLQGAVQAAVYSIYAVELH